MKIYTCLKTLMLVSTILMIGACSVLPKLPFTEQANNKVQEKIVDDDQVDIEEYRQEIKDLLALRDSINRVVALEGDLSYLLEEVGRFEEQNPDFQFEQSDALSEADTLVYNRDGLVDEKQSQAFTDSKFSSAPLAEAKDKQLQQSTSQNIKLGRAQPSLRAPSLRASSAASTRQRIERGAEGASNSKFRNQSAASEATVVSAQPTADKCLNFPDSSIGVHLASYSTMAAARSGWQTLQKQHQGKLCGASAKVQEVQVRGKTFFSLRVGGYASRVLANQACDYFKSQSQYCAVASFQGDAL